MLRLFILTLIMAACTADATNPVEVTSINTGPLKVLVQTVTRKPVTRKVLGEGVLRPVQSVMIHTRGRGLVKKVFVENGDYVHTGDTLAVMKDDVQKLSFRAAKARLDRCRYNFESERMGYSSREGVPDTIINAIRLSSGLREAKLSLEKALMELEAQTVLSPAEGVIRDWNISEGELLSPDRLLGVISDRVLQLEALLPETDIRMLRRGMTGKALTIAGDSLQCVLNRIIPEVDEKGRIRTIWSIKDSQLLMAGQHCALEGELVLREGIFVPRSALVQRGDNAVVFVVRNDTARWVNVTTGWFSEDHVEIRSGLQAGENVVLSNQYAIDDGSRLEIIIE